MLIYGQWVGWGLGDWSHNPDGSDRDDTVRRAKKYMRAMFRSYAGHLADTNVYDQQMAETVFIMQGRLVNQGRLREGEFYWGILDLPTQQAMGFKKAAPSRLPIIFTAEGHMSDMFVGPCAFTAKTLEAQGVCRWKPLFYNNKTMPFDNDSLVRELRNQLGRTEIEGPIVDGKRVMWPFPQGNPWGIIDFSQGVIGTRETFMRHIIPPEGDLHWRLESCRRSLSFGSPYRERDQCAPWVPDPPDAGTQGISDRRFNVAGTPFGARHREHSRHGDLYAENQVSEAGEKKTAIYKAVQGKFTGQGSLINEALEIFTDPMGSIFPVVQAIWTGGMFLFNMGPHGMYDLAPAVEWMRGVKA